MKKAAFAGTGVTVHLRCDPVRPIPSCVPSVQPSVHPFDTARCLSGPERTGTDARSVQPHLPVADCHGRRLPGRAVVRVPAGRGHLRSNRPSTSSTSTKRYRRELRQRDGFIRATAAWVFMSAIATVPLLIALPGLSFTDAFFETMPADHSRARRFWSASSPCPRPSIFGDTRSIGTAGWASSC